MKPARRSRPAGLCRRDAATWPAPATEASRLRSGPASPYHLRTPPSGAYGPRPRPASMRTPSPFPGLEENLSRTEGILRFGSAKHVTLMHVHQRVTPNVASALCSLLTRLVPVLRQADGHCEHWPGPVRYGYSRNHSKRFHILADTDLLRAPLPALGVRARTVGDFFVAGQFMGEGGGRCSANHIQ
jgi:hypothetical protein